MKDFLIFNGYPGIGGNRKNWDEILKEEFGYNYKVVAVEINEQVANVYKKNFPRDEVIIGDAHEYLLNNFQKFDFIWLSPPCQTHSSMQRVNAKRYGLIRYPDMKLWQEIILLKEFFKGLYVVENVNPYYDALIPPTSILNRHYFWSNFKITYHKKENVKNFIDAKFDDIKKWLGFDDFDERIYLNGTHDYTQILRNCVHPDTGLHILKCALNKFDSQKIQQASIW